MPKRGKGFRARPRRGKRRVNIVLCESRVFWARIWRGPCEVEECCMFKRIHGRGDGRGSGQGFGEETGEVVRFWARFWDHFTRMLYWS